MFDIDTIKLWLALTGKHANCYADHFNLTFSVNKNYLSYVSKVDTVYDIAYHFC